MGARNVRVDHPRQANTTGSEARIRTPTQRRGYNRQRAISIFGEITLRRCDVRMLPRPFQGRGGWWWPYPGVVALLDPRLISRHPSGILSNHLALRSKRACLSRCFPSSTQISASTHKTEMATFHPGGIRDISRGSTPPSGRKPPVIKRKDNRPRQASRNSHRSRNQPRLRLQDDCANC